MYIFIQGARWWSDIFKNVNQFFNFVFYLYLKFKKSGFFMKIKMRICNGWSDSMIIVVSKLDNLILLVNFEYAPVYAKNVVYDKS